MIGILLEKGADRTARDVDGNTPLMLAELCDHTVRTL